MLKNEDFEEGEVSDEEGEAEVVSSYNEFYLCRLSCEIYIRSNHTKLSNDHRSLRFTGLHQPNSLT